MSSILIKSYSADGATYNGLIPVVGDISFSKFINGGLGELVILVPKQFDDFNEGVVIDLMNYIKVIVSDDFHPSGQTVYTGYIDSYRPVIEGGREYVEVRCLGYASLLEAVFYRNGADVTITHTAQTADDMFEDVIDKYQTIHADSPLTYTADSVNSSGNTFTMNFGTMTCLESLDRIRENAGSNKYWYIGADNVVYFQSKPSSATHRFILGRDIVSRFSYTKSVTDVVNEVIFWNGQFEEDLNPLSRRFYDTEYQSDYWVRQTAITDSRITNATYARQLGEGLIDSLEVANHQITFEVIGRYIDIKNIEPGDTCKILNVTDSAVFSSNMTITQVDYSVDSAIITTEDLRAFTPRSLTKLRRQLNKSTFDNQQPNLTDVNVT